MAERERGEREKDSDQEKPRIGNRHEALESLRKAPLDDARALFNVYLRLAFCEGQLAGRDEECECAERLVRATCCCERHHRRHEEWDDEDDEREDDEGNGERRRRRR